MKIMILWKSRKFKKYFWFLFLDGTIIAERVLYVLSKFYIVEWKLESYTKLLNIKGIWARICFFHVKAKNRN